MSSTTGTDDVVRNPLGALGVLGALAGFGTLAGIEGIVAGVAVGLCWYVLPSAYAFALGQFLAAAFVGPVILQPSLVLLELGLFGVLLGPLLRQTPRARGLATGAAFVVVLLLVAGGVLLTSGSLPYAVAALALVTTAVAAALSSYEFPEPDEPPEVDG